MTKMPEKIYMWDDSDGGIELTSADDQAGVAYIRHDVFNPDWDQVDAAHDSLLEHMRETRLLKIANEDLGRKLAKTMAHANSLCIMLDASLHRLDWYRARNPEDDSQDDDEFKQVCEELLGRS